MLSLVLVPRDRGTGDARHPFGGQKSPAFQKRRAYRGQRSRCPAESSVVGGTTPASRIGWIVAAETTSDCRSPHQDSASGLAVSMLICLPRPAHNAWRRNNRGPCVLCSAGLTD